MSWVRIPPEAAHFSLEKKRCLEAANFSLEKKRCLEAAHFSLEKSVVSGVVVLCFIVLLCLLSHV